MTYALWNLQERGSLFISPQTEVYEGMIIGESARNVDMDDCHRIISACKAQLQMKQDA